MSWLIQNIPVPYRSQWMPLPLDSQVPSHCQCSMLMAVCNWKLSPDLTAMTMPTAPVSSFAGKMFVFHFLVLDGRHWLPLECGKSFPAAILSALKERKVGKFSRFVRACRVASRLHNVDCRWSIHARTMPASKYCRWWNNLSVPVSYLVSSCPMPMPSRTGLHHKIKTHF